MSKSQSSSNTESSGREYVLQLYITGATHHSTTAVKNIKRLCEKYLKNCYKLEIIDIYQQPQLAQAHQIIAVPTLIKVKPEPSRRLVGDLSNTEAVIAGLDLK